MPGATRAWQGLSGGDPPKIPNFTGSVPDSWHVVHVNLAGIEALAVNLSNEARIGGIAFESFLRKKILRAEAPPGLSFPRAEFPTGLPPGTVSART